jgi:hypothetical protein
LRKSVGDPETAAGAGGGGAASKAGGGGVVSSMIKRRSAVSNESWELLANLLGIIKQVF